MSMPVSFIGVVAAAVVVAAANAVAVAAEVAVITVIAVGVAGRPVWTISALPYSCLRRGQCPM
eukprot:849115-Prorocentrum_lima.AAC.1